MTTISEAIKLIRIDEAKASSPDAIADFFVKQLAKYTGMKIESMHAARDGKGDRYQITMKMPKLDKAQFPAFFIIVYFATEVAADKGRVVMKKRVGYGKDFDKVVGLAINDAKIKFPVTGDK